MLGFSRKETKIYFLAATILVVVLVLALLIQHHKEAHILTIFLFFSPYSYYFSRRLAKLPYYRGYGFLGVKIDTFVDILKLHRESYMVKNRLFLI